MTRQHISQLPQRESRSYTPNIRSHNTDAAYGYPTYLTYPTCPTCSTCSCGERSDAQAISRGASSASGAPHSKVAFTSCKRCETAYGEPGPRADSGPNRTDLSAGLSQDMSQLSSDVPALDGGSLPWLLTVPQAARLASISRSLAYVLVAPGGVWSHIVVRLGAGRALRVSTSGLREWIEANQGQR